MPLQRRIERVVLAWRQWITRHHGCNALVQGGKQPAEGNLTEFERHSEREPEAVNYVGVAMKDTPMRLTFHTDYALRMLLLLAIEPDARHTIEEVARRYGIYDGGGPDPDPGRRLSTEAAKPTGGLQLN